MGSEKIELAGVYDEDPALRAAAAGKRAVEEFHSIDDALAGNPALALIGAIPAGRPVVIARALAAGAAVLTDKPLALSAEALEEIMAAQRRAQRPVIVLYTYRGTPPFLAAKRAFNSGVVGNLVRVFASGPHKMKKDARPAWHWTRAGNGGALIDIGCHYADLCCWIAGQTPDWVHAAHGNFTLPEHPEFQDYAQASMGFPGGAYGSFEIDWLHPASAEKWGDTRLWVQGTAGKIEVRMGDRTETALWTDAIAGEPLDTTGLPERSQWLAQLIEDLVEKNECGIPQADVWRASRVSLRAFESAQAGGLKLLIP